MRIQVQICHMHWEILEAIISYDLTLEVWKLKIRERNYLPKVT
jgi:hypothetical protein